MKSDVVDEERHQSSFSVLGRNTSALLFLLFLLLTSGTYGAYRSVDSWTEKAIREEFASTAENASYLLRRSVERVQGIMDGAKGLFDASKTVEREEWQTYFSTTSIAEKYPEIYGVAYIERVKNQDKISFTESVRRDASTRRSGYPDFAIFPESRKDEYFVLKYIEPAALEGKALGFDISSDDVRFQTLRKAGETGEIIMTPFIKFVTGASGPTMYLPVYRKGVPLDTPEERTSAVAGFIVSGLGVPQFFQEIFHPFTFPKGFSIRIRQRGIGEEEDRSFYDSTTGNEIVGAEQALLHQTTDTLEIGGQMWELESTATSEFKKSAQLLPRIILYGGSAISFLVFVTVIVVAVSNARAIRKERTNAEELRTSNQFLDSIIENIPDMIFVKDAEKLRFVRFNKAGEELLGYRRSELVGKNDYDFFPKEQADFFTKKDQAVLRRGMLVDIPEEPIMTRKKGERILHTKKIPLFGHDGEPRYLLGISEDITERLREERAKAEFVTLVSHQLRTPLSAMRWSFEILRERLSHFSDTERRLMHQSYRAILNMAQTINTMLTIARIDTRKVAVNVSEFSLSDALRSLIHEFSIEAESKHLSLTLSSHDDCRIKSDPNLLHEIFANLLSNAIQYTVDGGNISVSICREGQQAVVAVADNGIGIPHSAIGSVFQKLFRAENAKKTKVAGSGLGLYVVRFLTTLLGGTVCVTSREGKGTTFIVRFPMIPSS